MSTTGVDYWLEGVKLLLPRILELTRTGDGVAELPRWNPDDAFGTELQTEINQLNPRLSELELRIRRSVVFAPKARASVTQAVSACLQLAASFLQLKRGNFDEIVKEMDKFNRAARDAHQEMLGLPSRRPA
jgi:hypothetical protein